MRKKIYIAYTGGTIGMRPSESGYAPGDNLMGLLSQKLSPGVLASLPAFELHEYPQLIDSSNVRPQNWQQIANDIAQRYHQFDGFVILHGTDTMAYSCAMLSFMLQNLHKPVIFTGSQIPLCEARTDAMENLIGALTLAGDERINEVCLYFNGRLLRGNRARKLRASQFDAFDTPNYPWLGRADIHIELDESLLWQPQGAERFQLQCDQQSHVGIVPLFPGITAQWMASVLNQPVDAIILQTYGTGNGPDSDQELLDTFAKATDQGKLIVNLTQCSRGRVLQESYAAGSALAQAGIVGGLDTTTEAMFCKLHYLYSQGLDTEAIRDMLSVSLAGESSV